MILNLNTPLKWSLIPRPKLEHHNEMKHDDFKLEHDIILNITKDFSYYYSELSKFISSFFKYSVTHDDIVQRPSPNYLVTGDKCLLTKDQKFHKYYISTGNCKIYKNSKFQSFIVAHL